MNNVALKGFMDSTGMNQKQVANVFGVSITTISQYLSGKYQGKTNFLDKKTEDLISQHKEKIVGQHYNAEFVPTFAAKMMLEVMRDAHVEGDVSVIFGAVGLGKTQYGFEEVGTATNKREWKQIYRAIRKQMKACFSQGENAMKTKIAELALIRVGLQVKCSADGCIPKFVVMSKGQ